MRMSIPGLGLLMLVSACATAPDHPMPPPGPQAFVSPFGEPFIAGPGEPYPVAAWFTGADSDRDDSLTPAEFIADGDRWFVRLDRDGDHILSFGEIARYEQDMALALQGGRRPEGGDGRRTGGRDAGPRPGLSLADNGDQQGPPGGGGRGGGGRGGDGASSRGQGGGSSAPTVLAMAGLLNVPQPVKSADINFDQKVTVDEWHATANRWFRLLDRDQDGRLVRAELPETALQSGQGRQGRRGGRRGPG